MRPDSKPSALTIDEAGTRIAALELENHLLRQEIRLLRIEKFGPSSEKLSDGQLELLESEPSVEQAEVEGEAALCAEQKEEIRHQAIRSRAGIHPGREALPPHLPRVEEIIACSPQACRCGQCGGATKVIGYEQSEVLDVEPAKYFVRVIKREKRACPRCEEMGVVTAPPVVRIVEKGKLSDAVVVDTLMRKYGEHTPLYRQLAWGGKPE